MGFFWFSRTLIYVDGTASLGRYEAKDGTSVHSVNIVQRKCSFAVQSFLGLHDLVQRK